MHVPGHRGWHLQGWASGERKQLKKERGVAVRETSLPVEDDPKRQPAFLICSVQNACLSQTTSSYMVDKGVLILYVAVIHTAGSTRCLV